MSWYMFYLFYILLIQFILCILRKNRRNQTHFLKTNYKLINKGKYSLKTYFQRKIERGDLYSKQIHELFLKMNKEMNHHCKRRKRIRKRKSTLKATGTFVSKYYKININDVYSYLNRKKYDYIETDIKITLKYCPFCPPHKYKYDNMYKHEIFKNTGNSYCHRCGYKGSFYDFKLKMGDLVTSNFENAVTSNTYEEEKITFNDVKVYNMNLLYSKEAENARKYLLDERKLNIETLKKFYIGFSIMEFQSLENSGKLEKHECLIFPFIKNMDNTHSLEFNGNKKNINENDSYHVVRIKVRSLRDKGYMRLYPKNVKEEMKLFFFGDHLVNNSEEIVLTEGEIDAMTVSQETTYSAISLPNGSKSLPIYLLPYLENFKKIHLWLDFDKAGKSSVFNFVNKIGLGRTNVITDTNVHYLNEEVFNKRKSDILTKHNIPFPSAEINSMHLQENKERGKQGIQNEGINRKAQTLMGDSVKTSSGESTQEGAKEDSQKVSGSSSSDDIANGRGEEGKEDESRNSFYFIHNNVMYLPNNITVKDANDCLKYNISLRFFIENSEKVKHSQILNFNDLRQNILEELKYPDRINGIKSKTIPSLNKFLYGLRMGELSIWTGATGVGKTTLLSQLSLDYCIQGVSTLWGSFEINNIKLGKVMLNQFCGKNLEKNIDLFDIYADKFELLPLKFLKFHGSTNIDQVLDAMDYAVYAYDVKHIIIDNLQFMLNINKFSDIYELQNIAIDKFRSFSTNKNVHITLVVHPRKEDNNLLSISSVFGSVKSTQEADNVFIIQRQVSKSNETVFFIDIKKNRFKGSLGRIPYLYNKENMTIKEMSISYLNQFISGNSYMPVNSSEDFTPNGGAISGGTLGGRTLGSRTSGISALGDGVNFTLCDEYDYMKQLAEEYESKHAVRRPNGNMGASVNGTNNGSICSMGSIGSGNLSSSSSSSPSSTASFHSARASQAGGVDNSQSRNKANSSISPNGKDHSGTLSGNKQNKDIFSTIDENDKHDGKSKHAQKQNKERHQFYLDTNNALQRNYSKEVSSPKKNEKIQMQNGGRILGVGISTEDGKEKTNLVEEVQTYGLSKEELAKLCKELEDDWKECLKNRAISISMRNCVIDNNSAIKDIRNFIKKNKLNIKTAGKNLKKVDIFINILQSVPREYITIVSEEVNQKKGKRKIVENNSFEVMKRAKSAENIADKGDIIYHQNASHEGSYTHDENNQSSIVVTENISNIPLGGESGDNSNVAPIKEDITDSQREDTDVPHTNDNTIICGKTANYSEIYEEELKSTYEDEVVNKYINDNIINVDDNIVKRNGTFTFENEGKVICVENLNYYEPKKMFDDDIESRFFLINDNNFNEKINYIYKNIKYCGLDIETTGLEVFDDKIRLIQISVENYPVIIYDMFNINNEHIFDGLKEILKNKDIIKIIQNGKFDTKFLMYNNFQIENIFDTYIASKLLDKNKNMYGFKLSNIVEKYLNVFIDKQQQNSIWNNSLLNNNQLFYAARDSSCLLKLYIKLNDEIKKENLNIVNDIENKCILPICDMELNGIKVDLENLKKSTNEILNELNVEKENLKVELKDDEINVNSQQQVLKALQNNNVRDLSNKLIENTSDANLKNFLNHKEVILLRNYRRLYKLYSAFYLKLPLHINKKTNKIHTTFNQLKTFSGRFSSEKPNLQQIPRQKNIREIFIPSENNIFIIADFKQIELKIAAEITNDDIMLKAYNNDIDLHTLTASIITKKSINYINKEDRHIAKAINFGLIYGMNYVNLKNYANTYYNLNMNLDQCLYFYNSFFEHYKGIYRWHNQIKQMRSLEYATLSNRKVVFPYFSFTKALNYPVQGTCADILKLSLVELYKNLKHINGKIILCVHDEIIIEVGKKHQEEALKILVESMENSASFFLKKVKCEVSVKIAQNWGSKD
ncbi:POM1 [Plasmodium ovale curtisi]|uniref:POM1 n=1 Tax=Plasmodium ovale curtisi TaxID=864141 RepID=A0A1A8X1W5_PLAOA|nr:POM1 [Plasmodium ovale curtisi]